MDESHPLIIIGARGFGLEVLFLAQRLGRPIKGFLDDNPAIVGSIVLGAPVLGSVEISREPHSYSSTNP